jgi:hypothetical protein
MFEMMKQKFNSKIKNEKKIEKKKNLPKKSSYYILRTLLLHIEDPSPYIFTNIFYT